MGMGNLGNLMNDMEDMFPGVGKDTVTRMAIQRLALELNDKQGDLERHIEANYDSMKRLEDRIRALEKQTP